MSIDKEKGTSTTQGVPGKLDLTYESLLKLDPNSLSDKSEEELVALIAESKASLRVLADTQRAIGVLNRTIGLAIKAKRVARVKNDPKTRKVVLTVEEYEKLKSDSKSTGK